MKKQLQAALLMFGIYAVAWAAEPVSHSPIAGVTPYQRPAGAPEIREFKKDSDWYERAMTGIQPPYPDGLGFLEDQGAWYTPFNHPGMTGPYDLRGWHRP